MGIPASSSKSTAFHAVPAGQSPESARVSDTTTVLPRHLATQPLATLKEKEKVKDPTIETLRGLAILCIVIGHVIGDAPNNGMSVEAGSIFRRWHETTRYLRSPLFFVISGYLYAHRPVLPGKFAEFARGKARLLLLPFLSVATLQFLLKLITPGVNGPTRLGDMWQIYVYGFDQFWFSQAAICTFITVMIFEKTLPIPHPFRWPVYLLLAIAFEIGVPKPPVFSFYPFAAMLPLFFLGCVLYRPPVTCPGPIIPVTALLVFVICVLFRQAVGFHRLTLADGPRLVLSYAEGFSVFYLLFRFRWTSPRLAVLAAFAYTIYLFHVFGTAGSRIVLIRLGIHDRLLLFPVGTFCGLALPVAIDLVFRRNLVLRRVFLGRR